MDEYKLLLHILEYCEEHGNRYDHVHFNVDHELVEELYDRYDLQPTIEELKALVDRCYAREWLEHAYLGGGRHKGLKLTAKGMGVAVSKRKSDEMKSRRTPFKKVSDYIEEHKGIFLLLGFLVAAIGLISTLVSRGFGNG